MWNIMQHHVRGWLGESYTKQRVAHLKASSRTFPKHPKHPSQAQLLASLAQVGEGEKRRAPGRSLQLCLHSCYCITNGSSCSYLQSQLPAPPSPPPVHTSFSFTLLTLIRCRLRSKAVHSFSAATLNRYCSYLLIEYT